MRTLFEFLQNISERYLSRDKLLKLYEIDAEEHQRQQVYVRWSQTQDDLPIWYRAWWLNSVCGKKYWSAFLTFQGGELVGVMPYVHSKILWIKIFHDPPLTQASGPWLIHRAQLKSHSMESHMAELAKQVKSYSLYVQHWHSEIDNWLPFYWNSFKQTTKYTNVLSLTLSTEELKANIRIRTKRAIMKAESFYDFEVIFEQETDSLIQACQKSYKRQGIKKNIDSTLVKRIATEAFQKDAVFIITVRRKSDSMIAASAMFLLDGKTAIYLLGGVDSLVRNDGFMSLLMWKAIEHCKEIGIETLDFEGSMTKSIDHFFQNFGATRVPYYRVTNASSFLLQILLERFLK